jgi:alkylated DNA repair dioxygenase AlkB
MYNQLNLFSPNHKSLERTTNGKNLIREPILMDNADVIIYRHLFYKEESDQLFYELYNNTNWRQDSISFYGKSIPLPRLTAWYGNSGKSYTYSGIEMEPEHWTPNLLKIKSKIEILADVEFNSVLLNLYRSGKDSVSWHSDDEAELGKNPVIASVSFGDTRRFMFREKNQKDARKIEIELDHGSFLIMRGETQHFWQHQVPKTSKPVNPRINLTFRVII